MMRTVGALAVVVGLAIAVGYAGYVVLETAHMLPGDVEGMLRNAQVAGPSERSGGASGSAFEEGLNLVHGGDLSNGERGMKLVFLGLFIGGLPIAVIGTVLAWYSRRHHPAWTDTWSPLFFCGFVFQLSSLVPAFMMLVFVGEHIIMSSLGPTVVEVGGATVNVAAICVGVGSWYQLRQSVVVQWPTLTELRTGEG
jgi:hypothetical protein